MLHTLVRYSKILEIIGDIIKVQVPESAHKKEVGPRFGDLAVVENSNGSLSLAQVIYPNVVKYDGTGDPRDPSSFSCKLL